MKKFIRSILVLAFVIASFLAGKWYDARDAGKQAASGKRRVLYYVDPMHPAYKSDKPGLAPDCGMQLEPVYADQRPEASGTDSSVPAGTVQISAAGQQIVGIRTEEVVKAPLSRPIRVLGKVAVDETRVFRLAAAADGLVRRAGPIVTGNIVHRDVVLATFYNREFLTAQQTYLYALNTMDRFKESESEDQLKLTQAQMRAAEENLEFLGMGQIQIREVARTREIAKDIELRSPVTGLMQARSVFSGLRFERGTELFRIADISHVWILADIAESEGSYFHPGTKVSVLLPRAGRRFQATISDVLPQFDANSQTLKLRLETDNPGYELRPDMFVDVELPVRLQPVITVPADAVIDSGLRKTVFVDRGKGFFEPRAVEAGRSFGDRMEIVKGLAVGEHVVVSGTFLVDSESRLKLAAEQVSNPAAGGSVAFQSAQSYSERAAPQ